MEYTCKMLRGRSATQRAKQEVSSHSSALLLACCSDRHTSPQELSIVSSYTFPHSRHYGPTGLPSQRCRRLLRRLGDDVKVSQKLGAVLFVALGPPEDRSTMAALLNAIVCYSVTPAHSSCVLRVA